jgi:hypothetical protein
MTAKQRATVPDASSRRRQITRLERFGGRGFQVAILLAAVAPIVLVLIGVLNLNSAATHAKLADSSLSKVLELWLGGPNPETLYPGHLVLALERVDDAVFQFAEVPVAIILLVLMWGRRKSAQELLALLKEHSA